MSNTSRQEGFWWVRWRKHDPTTGAQTDELERWEVAEVAACDWEALGLAYSTAKSVRTSRGTAMSSSTLLEWGPYLGQEPATAEIRRLFEEINKGDEPEGAR